MAYAGQIKISNEIEKKIKKEKSSKKSNAKKANTKKVYYYAKLLNLSRKA
jgi:hypothetical protein